MDYVVQDGDYLSGILFKFGLGRQGEEIRIYGEKGWLRKNLEANPNIGPSTFLQAGDHITLVLPQSLATTRDISAKIGTGTPHETSGADHFQTKSPKAQAPNDAIKQKLDGKTILPIVCETATKVPEYVKNEPAWESSICDSFESGMSNLLGSSAAKQVAEVFLGIRFAHSVSTANTFLGGANAIGLLYESRSGPARGLRFQYERLLPVKKSIDGIDESLSYQRILLGYAFEYEGLMGLDHVHVTPKIASFAAHAELEVGRDSDGNNEVIPLNFRNATSYGLELDVEKASLFYGARLWAGMERSFAVGWIQAEEQISTKRFGFDLFLKGTRLSSYSLSYLIFVADEKIDLIQKDEETEYTISLDFPYAGVGVGLCWQ